MYINGEFVSTGNITLGNTTGDPTLKIGARFDKNGNFFGGKIADFRVFDSPLNSYQIQKLYQGEKTNGPIVHYTFDNSSSEIIKDMGSEGAHLTSIEGVLDNIKQKVGTSCLYFNGNTSVLNMLPAVFFAVAFAVATERPFSFSSYAICVARLSE